MRRFVKALLALGAVLALAACQSWLIFEPDRKLRAAPSDFSFRIVEVAVPVRPAAGGRTQYLNGWWIPSSQPDARTVLYFHGNDDNVSRCVTEGGPLRKLGYNIFLVDYRGFGESDGRVPSETTVYEDAEAAWNYLVADRGVPTSQLYIYGHSLGGAIAIELARRHPEAAGLIVESSFTSIYDMSQLDPRYRLLPVKRFLNQRFESVDKVSDLKVPVLILHGTQDEVVPYWMGERLFSRAPAPKQFFAIEGGRHDHDESGEAGMCEAIDRFVQSTPATVREAFSKP